MISSDGARNPDALREEIRRTRAELGQTVEALAAKADVKARARESTARTAQRAQQRVRQLVGRASAPARGARTHLSHGADLVRESARNVAIPVAARRTQVPRTVVLATLGAGIGVAVVFIVLRTVRGGRR